MTSQKKKRRIVEKMPLKNDPVISDLRSNEPFKRVFTLLYTFLLFWLPLDRTFGAAVLGAAVRVFLVIICFSWCRRP